MPITDEQLAKLPKYARREIEGLRRTVEYLREQQRTVEGEETDTYYQTMGDRGYDRNFLPDGTGVVFLDSLQARVTQYKDGGPRFLDIMGMKGGLIIQPAASNHVTIRSER
jgi:hypothetical protein